MSQISSKRDKIVVVLIIVFNILFWSGLFAFGLGYDVGAFLAGTAVVGTMVIVWGGLLLWAVYSVLSLMGWPPRPEAVQEAGRQLFVVVVLVLVWVAITAFAFFWTDYAGKGIVGMMFDL